jgi:hypothetical protein
VVTFFCKSHAPQPTLQPISSSEPDTKTHTGEMGRQWSGQFTDLDKKDSTNEASQQPDPLSSSTSTDNLKKRQEDAKVEGRYMEMEEKEW